MCALTTVDITCPSRGKWEKGQCVPGDRDGDGDLPLFVCCSLLCTSELSTELGSLPWAAGCSLGHLLPSLA